MTTGCIILRVHEVLKLEVLLLEGCDGKLWKDQTRNCVPCHLPHIDGQIDSRSSHVLVGLKCVLCSNAKSAATMVLCDICSTGWHTNCLSPPLQEILVDQCVCPKCVLGHRRSSSSS